jgi:hypothetical protein
MICIPPGPKAGRIITSSARQYSLVLSRGRYSAPTLLRKPQTGPSGPARSFRSPSLNPAEPEPRAVVCQITPGRYSAPVLPPAQTGPEPAPYLRQVLLTYNNLSDRVKLFFKKF